MTGSFLELLVSCVLMNGASYFIFINDVKPN